MTKRIRVAAIFALALLAAAPCRADEQGAAPTSPWKLQLVTYLWLPEVQGSVAARGLDASVDVGFGDMFDLLGNGDLFAAGGHLEVGHDRLSFFVDAFGGTVRPASNVAFGPNGRLTGRADLTMNFTFVEFGPAYRLLDWPQRTGERPISVDVLTGGRFMYFYDSIALRGTRGVVDRFVASTSSWVDPFVGGRFSVPLGGELDLLFRADVGGFGAGSQLVWNLIGGFQCALPWRPWGAATSIVAVYKALDFDYESGSGSEAIDLELDYRGPALGLAFEL